MAPAHRTSLTNGMSHLSAGGHAPASCSDHSCSTPRCWYFSPSSSLCLLCQQNKEHGSVLWSKLNAHCKESYSFPLTVPYSFSGPSTFDTFGKSPAVWVRTVFIHSNCGHKCSESTKLAQLDLHKSWGLLLTFSSFCKMHKNHKRLIFTPTSSCRAIFLFLSFFSFLFLLFRSLSTKQAFGWRSSEH